MQPTVARFRRGSYAVKIETTYGQDPTLAAADLVAMRNIVYRALQEQFRDDRQTGLIADFPDIPGARAVSLSGDALLRGAGAAYSASVKPDVDALLRSMGFAAAGDFTVSAEKWTYTPQSGATMGESVTAALFAENAPQGKALGAFGTGRIICRRAEPAVYATTLTGLYTTPSDVALITAAPPSLQPPVFKSGVVTFDAVTTFRVSGIEVDIGNDLQYLPSANDAQGYAAAIIANRRMMLTLDPEAVTVATYNFFSKLEAGTLVAVSWQVGTAQYQRIKFSCPKVQILDITEGQRNGARVFNLTCKLNPNAGGDEISLVFD